ncbi:hypothetical protein ABXT08_11830 [Chryseobacterium sp. NRRL B-14859]|uniref:hypothetical protein n=1 Tax=Chryseobacterium sp. NRRL B-14859 TaxID=1562763 RepID=UPI00339A1F24
MLQKDLEYEIQDTVKALFILAGKNCWNKISSNNIVFILSDFNEFEGVDLGLRKYRRINNSKLPVTLGEAAGMLRRKYHDLYDVNLYIFRSLKKGTIIEIQYYRKSSLKPDYFELVKDNPPMFHAKVAVPAYALEGGKFDVNWKSGGGLHHAWKTFLFRSFWYKVRRKKGKE